ncbi:MAG TPA: alpha-L-rhamnosidase [Solibacterales bacterium]|nr:alpha-L-rhamnosidase [Bryobacterales bacterium]
MTRREFAGTLLAAAAQAQARFAQVHVPTEWSFTSEKSYRDPFNEVELDVTVTAPSGKQRKAPAFWGGGNVWRVRYAAAEAGRHRWAAVCSDTSNGGLHGRNGTLDVSPYEGSHPLYRHGPLRVSANKRYLQHADGTPFFWLGDTWWMALVKRLHWPDDFQRLVADRVSKNFTVIQFVAGLYPDMDSFDPRGENEAGFPWEPGYERINPAWWDVADLRVQHMVAAGLTPCVLGCWGYYLPKTGERRMKQHWRNIVARWGAYPVVWTIAGETSMPWYLSNRKEAERKELATGWTAMARYIGSVDPFERPITAHPSETARASVDDPSVLDFNMLQTGHSDRRSIPNTIRKVTGEYAAEPRLPVLNGEVNYEGILAASREEMQRFMFWTCMLNGACGHTYGANGIWQVNLPGKPYGPSPHGRAWGNVSWQEAMALPGAAQLGRGAKLLQRYAWHRFEPHPDWIDPSWSEKNYEAPSCAGIPGEVRIAYLPQPAGGRYTFRGLEPGVAYRAKLWDPVEGREQEWVRAEPVSGAWTMPPLEVMQDWVVILEKSA